LQAILNERFSAKVVQIIELGATRATEGSEVRGAWVRLFPSFPRQFQCSDSAELIYNSREVYIRCVFSGLEGAGRDQGLALALSSVAQLREAAFPEPNVGVAPGEGVDLEVSHRPAAGLGWLCSCDEREDYALYTD
jgi:hypothetical protein